MKQRSIIILLAVLMSMVGVKAFAQEEQNYDFEVDGIYYRILSDYSYYDDENYIYCDGTVQVVNPNGEYESSIYEGSIYIPSSITITDNEEIEPWESSYDHEHKYAVTSIGEAAFAGCCNLTSIYIPASVKWIGDGAFYCCSSLTKVTIPSGVTEIGDGAFYKCSS